MTAQRIRDAEIRDIPSLVTLIRALGYEVDEEGVSARLDQLVAVTRPPLVADDGRVIGCVTWSLTACFTGRDRSAASPC